jgi:PAS domain S-box-containing protein
MRRCAVTAQPEAVTDLRHEVTAFAEGSGASEERAGDISIAVSEAVTNAVMHAFVGAEAPGTIEMVAEAEFETIVVRIIDDGIGMRPRHDSPGLGIGLPLIGQLARSVDLRTGPGDRGTEVCMTFDAPGVRGAPPPALDEGARSELLTRVAGITDGSGWPFIGYERLLAVLVPAIADACTLDVLEGEGGHRRLGARVAGPLGKELSDWLAGRTPQADQIEATLEAHREGRPRLLELTPELVGSLARSPEEQARMDRMPLSHWLNLPLMDRGVLIGTLGLGFSPERPSPAGDLDFLVAVADRAARGLANTRIVDELRRTSDRFQRILGALSVAVTVNDERGKVVYANDAAVELLGASSMDEILAAEPGELAARFLISHEDGSPVEMEELPGRRVLKGEDAPALLTRSVKRVSGREYWMLTTSSLLDAEGGLAVNIMEDVTEAKTAELRQRFLAEAGDLLYSARDLNETLERVATLLIPQHADWCAVDLVGSDGAIDRVALVHKDAERRAFAHEIHRRWPPRLGDGSAVSEAIESRRAVLVPVITDEMLSQSIDDAERLGLIRQVGMRSAIIAPILAGDTALGALTLVNAESRRSFADDDLQFATDVGRRAGAAILIARRRLG